MHINRFPRFVDIADLKLATEGTPGIEHSKGDEKITTYHVCKALTPAEDGTITLTEFLEMFTRMLAVESTEVAVVKDENVTKMYDTMDTNNDGIVDKIEFLEFIRVHKPK